MNAKIRRSFNKSYKGSKGYEFTGESKTVPNQALTVRQIIERQKAGHTMEGAIRQGHYFESEEIPVFEDITDYYAWKEQMENRLKESKLKHEEASKLRRDIEAKLKEAEDQKPETAPDEGE